MTWTDEARRVARSPQVRRGAKLLGVAVAVVVLVPFLLYAFPTLAGAKESYVVLSGSMQPSLAPGDVILVYGADPASIEEGDVVTYRRGSNKLVTHRVVNVTATEDGQRAFRTKGDANEDPDDELVPASALVGRVPTLVLPVVGPVLVHVPALGRVIVFVNRSPVTFLVAIGAIIAVDELRKVVSKRHSAVGDSVRDDPVGEGAAGDDPGEGTAGDDPGEGTAGDDPGEGAVPDEAPTGPSGARERGDGASAGFVLTGVDLRLTAVVLVALATYGGVVGLLGRSPLGLSVAAGAVVGLFAVGQALYGSTGGPDVDDATDRPDPVPTDEPVAGRVTDREGRLPVVGVDSPDELFERADEDGGWVVRDGGDLAYTDGAVLFVRDLDDEAVPAAGAAGEATGDAGTADPPDDEPVADPPDDEPVADPPDDEPAADPPGDEPAADPPGDEPVADDRPTTGFEFGTDGGDSDDD